MKRGDIQIKRQKNESVTYETRISGDKKSFVLIVESSSRMTWLDILDAIYVYVMDEWKKLRVKKAHPTEQ